MMKNRMKIIFRAHDILHQTSIQLAFELLPFAVQILYIIVISTFFLVLRLHANLGTLISSVLFLIGILVSISLQVIYKLVYNLTSDSSIFPNSFIRSNSMFRTHEDRLFFRSCRKFRLNIGNFFMVARNTFPTVMHEVILSAVINLLVAVPSQHQNINFM